MILLVVVALTRPRRLRIRRDEIGPLLVYGIFGVAMTQYLYFVAIGLLPVGVALLFEFTAPIMVALWFRFGLKDRTPRVVWLALLIALVGLAMVAQVWQGFTLDRPRGRRRLRRGRLRWRSTSCSASAGADRNRGTRCR